MTRGTFRGGPNRLGLFRLTRACLISWTGRGGGNPLPWARAGGTIWLRYRCRSITARGGTTLRILVMCTELLVMVRLMTVWLMRVTREMYPTGGPQL